MTPKILHGPYGDAWAYVAEPGLGCHSFGWRRAKDELHAIEEGKKELTKWGKLGSGEEPIIDRVTVPVRPPKMGSTSEKDEKGAFVTNGEYVETNAAGEPTDTSIPFGGACPVQGEGAVDGHEAYYRARGTGWSLEIMLGEGETWNYGENAYAWPDGGWLHRDESSANIEKGVAMFRSRMGPCQGEHGNVKVKNGYCECPDCGVRWKASESLLAQLESENGE